MTSKKRALKSSEARQLLQDFKRKFPKSTVDHQGKQIIEEMTVDHGKLFLMNDKPFALSIGDRLFPALSNEELLRALPSVIVDMGAIPHICNGADIMRPGIREIQGEFEKGGVILVKDVRFGKPIAIGVAEISSEIMRVTPKGKAAENLHYVGDRFWEAMKKSR